MGEVCEIFDLPASTIRFWEGKFSELRPRKNAKGNRQFTKKDIDILKVIHNLVKERGMTIEGAKASMKAQIKSLKQDVATVDLLLKVRASLESLLAEIESTHQSQEQLQNTVIIQQEIALPQEHDIVSEAPLENESKSTQQTKVKKASLVQHELFNLDEFTITDPYA